MIVWLDVSLLLTLLNRYFWSVVGSIGRWFNWLIIGLIGWLVQLVDWLLVSLVDIFDIVFAIIFLSNSRWNHSFEQLRIHIEPPPGLPILFADHLDLLDLHLFGHYLLVQCCKVTQLAFQPLFYFCSKRSSYFYSKRLMGKLMLTFQKSSFAAFSWPSLLPPLWLPLRFSVDGDFFLTISLLACNIFHL